MTYDQWKTTDPRDYEPEEDQPSEIEELELTLFEVRRCAQAERLAAERRIKELESALEEALEYFKDKYDVVDGSYGEPRPNKEMALGQMIDIALHGIQF